MIVVDTSAIMAILLDEIEAAAVQQVLSPEDDVRLSAMRRGCSPSGAAGSVSPRSMRRSSRSAAFLSNRLRGTSLSRLSKPIVDSAKVIILRRRVLPTAPPTLWPRASTCPYCSRAAISRAPMSVALSSRPVQYAAYFTRFPEAPMIRLLSLALAALLAAAAPSWAQCDDAPPPPPPQGDQPTT